MPYKMGSIDVHKRMLAVVTSDVEIDGEYQFERRRLGTNPAELRLLADWLLEQQVEEVVMESTAQYWRPVWEALEQYWKPVCQKREGARPTSGTRHLAQAHSNRAPRGRKRDFADAERLLKRRVASELTLSFVPDPEQRLGRTVTRAKYPQTRNRAQLQNRLEALLEEAHIKLSSLVSDLLGASARRILKALADGETDPAALAGLADYRLRATPEQLRDALGACQELNPVYRRLLKAVLEESHRQADCPARPGTGRFASSLPGPGGALGGGTRSGGGLGAADYCPSGRYRRDVSLRGRPLVLGGRLPWRRRDRRRQPQPSVSQGQPPHTAHSQSGRQRCGPAERKHL